MKLRVRLVGAAFLFCLLGVLARAVSLQVFERDRLRELAEDQYVRQVEIPARRGDIFDRRGVPLAQSVEVDSIWVDPSLLGDLGQAAKKLAPELALEPSELEARLSKAKRFAWVKRRVRPEEAEAVRALGLPGVGLTKEPRRFYPQRELAGQLIGFVGADGRGLDGLELAFEDELSGESMRVSGYRDARGRKLLTDGLADSIERRGASVTLTIDRHLQFFAEKALSRAAEESKAAAASAVVLDPRTGELLAIANHPRFNPNTPEKSPPEGRRNRAALDTFEPGSTFKSFVVAAALEEGRVKPQDGIHCENGAWDIGRHTVHDTHSYGWLSVGKVLQVSSNICAAKIAQALGRDALVDYSARFGFGERAGLSLPGEGKGVVPYPKAEIAVATQAFGQGLTATAVQLAAAYGALANGGVLMRPYLVSRVVDPDGLALLEGRPVEVRRVVSAETARTVVKMLEAVVEKEGTAPRARLDEYKVAGKTGTAQKADLVAGGYSDKRIASFVGLVPSDGPRLVILVVVDEPKTDVYGGLVAAPVFKEIASAAMPYLGVAPSSAAPVAQERPKPKPADRSASRPLSDAFLKVQAQDPVTEQVEKGTVRVPDLSGEVGRVAVSRLLAAALTPRLTGTGRVVKQEPPAGSLVEKGARVTVQLAGGLPPLRQ
ncbi:MAG: PASTA domain-containing protein [Myxococcales bacterium]|nr:PASTA domain-containing protein [Myxococcales bacterium]